METTESNKPFGVKQTKGLGFALILIAIGTVLLAVNAGLLAPPYKWVIISWPMLLIVIGVAKLIKRNFITACILLLIGGFFLTSKIIHAFPETFPGLNGNFTHTYWPLLLIAAGILLLISKIYDNKWNQNPNKTYIWSTYNYESGSKHKRTGTYEKNSIFGGGEHIVLEPDFRGGELNAVFGGMTLDLRHTNLAEGVSHLEANAIFGGITIIVPSEWLVEVNIDAVFGGFEDKRVASATMNSDRKLIITGACVFGGGEIHN